MARFNIILLALLALSLSGTLAKKNLTVSKECLGCICQAMTGCDTSSNPFRMTEVYWIGAGNHTVANESRKSSTAFTNCARDLHCSALTVRRFMKKHQQDCNNDRKIDCDDYVRIHQFGPYGCNGTTLPYYERQLYDRCKLLTATWDQLLSKFQWEPFN